MGFIGSPFLLESVSKNLENIARKARMITKGMERFPSCKQGSGLEFFCQIKKIEEECGRSVKL